MVAALDPLRELDLLRRREERHLADVLQEELQRVGGDLRLGRLPRALCFLLRLRRIDDLDLLLVERVVERVDLGGVEVELVEGERDLVRGETPLRAPLSRSARPSSDESTTSDAAAIRSGSLAAPLRTAPSVA